MLIPIDRIVSMLTDRIEELCRELLPGGHREGHEWREASTRKGGLGDSLSVHLASGPRRGIWARHGSGDAGDALDLVAFVHCGGDKKAAIIWAKKWLGLAGADGPAMERAMAAASPRPRDDRAAQLDMERRRGSAYAMYLSSQPIENTPVQKYLAGRDIDIRRLPYPLRAIRYHPELWDRFTQRRWPAMVAAITGADGKFMSVHRTFLERLGDGSVRKAPIVDEAGKQQAKRTLGVYRGGTIRLWRGTRVDPKTGEVKQARPLRTCQSGEWVDLTEGIEDGLTVAIADTEARVMCGVSLGNFTCIRLPDCVAGVALWRQNDAPGSRAELQMDRAVQHFLQMGKQVADCRPPPDVKDVNDWVRQANSVRREGYALNV